MTSVGTQGSDRATELTELQCSRMIDNVLVRARCFAVPTERGRRYEIVLDGHGQVAKVDVHERAELDAVRDNAMVAYAASIRLRAAAVF